MAESPNERVRRVQTETLAEDVRLRKDLARRYGAAWVAVKALVDDLSREIEAARARGEIVDEVWLRDREVIRRFRTGTRAEVAVFLEYARRRVDGAVLERAAAGTADANELVRSSLPSGAQPSAPLPVQETTEMIAATRPGAPLAALFEPLGPEAASRATEALIRGVAEGLGPREIARTLKLAMATPLWRTLTIARTETLGAYRRAAVARYVANRHLLDGWVWVARLDKTTCPVCVAMHGTTHAVDEPFATHPSCRCAPVPLTKPWAELGFPGLRETRFRTETGEQWFARQPRDTQRVLLGPGKLELYEQGNLPLADLVVDTQHPLWGPGRRERPLRDLPLAA